MQIGHGHGVDHAYITGKTVEAHGHQYVVDDPIQRVAATGLDEHQQRALKRLSQFPHELIQGPEAHQLMAEHNIHYHEEDPWEAGEVGDDHMTADTGASLHHAPDVPLHTSQDYLSRAGLEHFIRHPYEPGQHEERPSTWEHEGQHWINGGHHRILADRMTHRRGTEVADRTPRTAAQEPPGAAWRSSLSPDHEKVIRQYEKYSPDMTSEQRTTFRKVVKSAPEIDGPVYRGVSVKNAYGNMEKIKAAHEPGSTINFSKHVSTSTRPEVAAGYGLAVYELHGHGARGIGNGLHEAIMPPGKFKVHSAEWRDTPAQANIDESTQYTAPRLHVVLHPVGKEAVRWKPHERLFGPTQGLDHRLFDGDHLKPDVRKYILETLYDFWKPTFGSDFDEWSIVYFAGSEASEWTSSTLEGNNDFDVLIGVDYVKMRGHMSSASQFQLMSDQEITDVLNQEFKRLDEQTAQAMIPVDGELVGPFSNTWYINPHSYDIRTIKPYAAYDVTHDEWAVKPPALPDWDITKFPEGPALVQECQAVASYVRSILKMPEPIRTQQGYALWQHLHGDRSRAFSDQGEGWWDPGNVIEKWLSEEGLWEKLVQIMVRAKSDPTSLNAPGGWSNDPSSGAS